MTAVAARRKRLGTAAPLVDGRWLSGPSGGSLEHFDPATGSSSGTVLLAGTSEVDAAVESAQAAAPAWRRMPGDERRRILLRLESLVAENVDELALLTTLELGHPMVVAQAQARVCASWCGYYAGWADKIEGATVPMTPGWNSGFDYTLLEPYGVVGIIITWNGPLASIGMKVAPALTAGNCVVLKTPELAPFAAARFAELALEAGVPGGALHVLPGTAEPGHRLVSHHGVGKISFTGGIATARRILEAAAATVKPVLLELGGKSANIIFADADLPAALRHAFQTCLGTAGQECAFPSRVLVEESIYETVAKRAAQLAGSLSVGDPLDPSTNVGPVVNAAAQARILAAVSEAEAKGEGRVISGGSSVAAERLGAECAGGYFVEPTVLADVDAASDLAQHEVFGPVISLLPFTGEEQALALANGTEYGLAATVHTRDVGRVHRMASELGAGSVRFNGALMLPPGAPFGGYKLSGSGREGGRAGLDEFLQTKNVFIKL